MELPPPGSRRVSISNPQGTPHPLSISSGVVPSPSSMGPSAGTSKLSTQSNLRSQTLKPSPILQKSSLSPPNASEFRRGSNVSSVHYADQQGKPLQDTDKDKDKDKAKEADKGKGTGTRLLNMLRKTLQGSQSEEMVVSRETPNLIPFGDVVGCLAVHIKSCRQFSHRFLIQQHVNLFIRISINHVVKCTKVRNLKNINNEKNFVLKFDEVKYFSVQVPRRQEDERNNIFLELMQDVGHAERANLTLGSVEAHLYEVIQKGCFTEVLQMMHRNTFICRMEVEFMFSYGNFGYGFSHQLKPLQKIIEPSMFMKIAPPPERTDPVTNVITPQRVEYPAFLSPEFNVTVGAAEASQPSVVRLEKLQEKPRERLEKMKEEYRNLNTWIEKAEYLRNLITPKVAHKDSEETNSGISEQFSDLLEEESDIHHRKPEATLNEPVDRGDKESLVIPVLKLVDQDLSEPILYKSDESLSRDTSLPPIHALKIIDDDQAGARLLASPEWESRPYEEKKNTLAPSSEKLFPKRPSILRIAATLHEVRHRRERNPHFSDAVTKPDKPLGPENTNQKGRPSIQLRKSWERQPTDPAVGSLRKVAFAQEENTIPVLRAEPKKFKPKHPKLSKGSLDPFLRNINSRMSFRMKKDQDTHRYLSTLSTEALEHEDQDPPYVEHSRSAGSTAAWAEDPNLITIHMVNKKNNLSPDRTTTTMTSDRKNRLSHDPTLNTTDTSNTKSVFTSDNPVISLTKFSESDLSTNPSSHTTQPSDMRLPSRLDSNATQPSDMRLPSGLSSQTTQPSDMRRPSRLGSNATQPSDMRLPSGLSSQTTQPSDMRRPSGPSSHTTQPSDMRLPSGPGSHTTQPSDMRLPSGLSSHTTQPSDMRLPSGLSSHTTQPSDMRLRSGPGSHTTQPSDMRLPSGPSSHTTQPSDMRLPSGPSSHTTQPSDMRLPSGPGSHTTQPSDMRLRSGPGSHTTQPSDMRLRSGPGSHTTQPSDMRRPSGPGSHTTQPSDMRLPSGLSSHTTQPSDMRLPSGPSSYTTQPSDMRLPSGPGSHTTQPSDMRLPSGPGSYTTQPSDMRLPSGPGSHTTQPSDMRLPSGPSSNTTQPLGTKRLAHDPSTISTKSSDSNKLSHNSNIMSLQSSDSKNTLSSGDPTAKSDLPTNMTKPPATKNKSVLDSAGFTIDTSGMQSKSELLPKASLPNYQRESPVTGNVDMYHPSSSIQLTSDIENLKQSIILKSILSKNLQDLSEELFSKPKVCTHAEGVPGSPALPLSVHDRLPGGPEDKGTEKVQDINSWLSSKDILKSQTLLSPVIKNGPQDLLPEGWEGRPGPSSNTEDVADKLLEAAEVSSPMNKKRSFKTKHLGSEVPGSSPGLNGSARDYVIKQIFTAPIFSQLGTGITALSEALQDQLLTRWEKSASSQILNYEEKGNEVPLSRPKSGISKILQSFPIETLLDSGIVKVIELDKKIQSSLLDIKPASTEEKLLSPTEQLHKVKSQTKSLSRQTTLGPHLPETLVNGADYKEDIQSVSAEESKYPRADKRSDLPKEHRSPDTEEAGLSSALEALTGLVTKLKDKDVVMIKSFLKNIFNVFFRRSKSERREEPEKESDRLIQHSSSRGTEHVEKIQENLNQADKADRPTLDPKLSVFLEKLSESEVKNLKSELSKHIQHYLLEKLSEAGHITKEDLPKIYRNLYLMNERRDLKEQSPFQDKYSETVKEIMSFVNNFNHYFIDKRLEIKLRSFLNEILQNYFLKNLSGSNLFSEADGVALCSSMSSLSCKSTSRSLHGLGQYIANGHFGSRLKINMKYPLNESLQNCLRTLSENELLSLKADLSKYIQVFFIDKLYKSGLVTDRQLRRISQQVNSLNSPSMPLKCIKTGLPLRDKSCSMREDSEEQKKYPKIIQNTTFRTVFEEICGETELTPEDEEGSSTSQGLQENPPTIWEHKHVYSREVKTLNLIKVQPPPNRNIQANPLNKSPERPPDVLLKKHKKDHGFAQLLQAENSVPKAETQEPCSWDGRAIQSKPCFEKTLKVKPLDKKDNNDICKVTVQEKPDTGFSPYLKLPPYRTSGENEHVNRLSFPTWGMDAYAYANSESWGRSQLDPYCQRWKGSNNNNKKHLVTFAQFRNEMDSLYINPCEACDEKCASISESQSFKHKEDENSRPSFFPEVLRRETVKSRRKERDYTSKPKKTFHKIVRILPSTLPTARPHLRKSVPRTLLHWTARRTIHDCLDRFDDLHTPPVKRPKNSRPRARLLGKSPDDSHTQAKHCARPYTAPDANKRRESVTGKSASPRMVSAGLLHIHDTTPEYEIRKTQSKRKFKENIEKRPLICDIIQMLDTAE